MKIYNEHDNIELTPALQCILDDIRSKKNFNASNYIKYKCFALNSYLKKHNIDTVIIGISGGVDSAVTLGILNDAKCDGVIKEIIAVCLPALNSNGAVTNQLEATTKGKLIINHFNLTPTVIDLSPILKISEETVYSSFKNKGSQWSSGQLVPNLRTAISYYLTSLCSVNDQKAVVIGTINRDEGSWLGYMGKAGDSLVDIQLISDIHKSEVYQLAQHFNLPSSVISAKPNGDMFDGRTDEELFGTNYDFVELYLNYLVNPDIDPHSISIESSDKFKLLSNRLNKLRKHNEHKYISSSPAVHLDLFDTAIESELGQGWKNNSTYSKDYPLNPNMLVNFISINENFLSSYADTKDVISKEEAKAILDQIPVWVEAGLNGKKINLKDDQDVGSYRATIYSTKLAKIVSKRIKYEPLVIHNNELFRYVGVNPSFRFIKYEEGGKLIPHYDYPYHASNTKMTLFSLVIYLKKAELGGNTRFIKDNRTPHSYTDWNDASEDDIVVESIPTVEEGQALIFPHHHFHDCSRIEKGEKIIIRTDLIYERVVP